MVNLKDIGDWLQQTVITRAAVPSTEVMVPDGQTDRTQDLAKLFDDDNDYFQVRINQLFLAKDRKWFTNINPMVFAVSEFQYDGQGRVVPHLVGPKKDLGIPIPQGMIFRDTTIAGLHPYKGGSLTITIVLSQVPSGSAAQKFMGVLERAGAAFPAATALSSFLAIGNVVLDGIDALFGLDGTVPLMGWRKTFDPQAGDKFKPCYVALINGSGNGIRPNELWIKNNQLLQGNSINDAKPYRQSDFVLFSITRAPDRRRNDAEQLPFYPRFHAVYREARSLNEGSWETAKGTP